MEFRNIGKTGMKAGVVGLGAEHLDGKPYGAVEETIRAALDCGMNMMDLFMPGEEVRRNIGKALGRDRDRMLIQGHIGSVDLKMQYDISRDLATCRTYFENLLRALDTDYIDFGMLFFIDSNEDYAKVFEGEILPYAQKLKEKGVIRAVGASAHNPETALRVVESGAVDLLMFSINPAFDLMPEVCDPETMILKAAESMGNTDPARARLYRACEQRGVAITSMKTYGAGKLLSQEHTPFSAALTPGQCIHYALTRPAVVSALVGCESRRQVEEAVKYLTLTPEERDYTHAFANYNGSFKGSCVYCNHCLPCPAGIDIATVNKYLDIAELNESFIPPSILQHYRSLAAHGGDCIQCGSCLAKCPFEVPVIERMKKAETPNRSPVRSWPIPSTATGSVSAPTARGSNTR